MTSLIRSHPMFAVIGALLVGAAVVALAWGVSAAGNDPGHSAAAATTPPTGTPEASASTTPTPTTTTEAPPTGTAPASTVVSCASSAVKVSTAKELTSALAAAKPGQSIVVAPGTYTGNFVASVSGTESQPISLCGSASTVLDGGNVSHGYGFHLDHASYWHLQGFTIKNAQKGLVADGTTGSIIAGLTVSHIGDEGIHLRDQSFDNVVTGNTVSDTGLRKPKFGEGIYIGTSKNNWGSVSNGQPDKSDRNIVEKNTISHTTAENVDIKEGTTGGILRENSFDGTGMTEEGGDSWVDVKGNGWTIEGNHGVHSINDGFQTHELLSGWGTDNTFSKNVAVVDGPGFGFSLTPVLGNKVTCDNTVTGAAQGVSNVTCSA